MAMEPETQTTIKDPTQSKNDTKPLTCRGCTKTFRNQAARTLHERVHTGEKPFECNECGKCFASSSVRLAHIRKHHKGGRPHKCRFCGNGFFEKAVCALLKRFCSLLPKKGEQRETLQSA